MPANFILIILGLSLVGSGVGDCFRWFASFADRLLLTCNRHICMTMSCDTFGPLTSTAALIPRPMLALLVGGTTVGALWLAVPNGRHPPDR